MLNVIIAAIAGLGAGGFLGFYFYKQSLGKKVSSAKMNAEKIIDDAGTKAKEIMLEAKDAALKEKELAKKEHEEKSKYIEKIEQDLRKLELTIDSRFYELEKTRKNLSDKLEDI